MTGRPVIGTLLALLVESPHWTKFRWEFNEEACCRAWQLTTIAIGLAAVLIFLDGGPYVALPNLLTWLPPLLLPMQFIQSFGLRDSLPLSTFSFIANHRRKRNLRLGLAEDEAIHLNFGNAYLIATLVASTLGSRANSWPFLPGMVVLTGWLLLSANRSRPRSLIVALIAAGGIAVAGQAGIEHLVNWFGNSGPGRSPFDPNSVSTMIGKTGTVQLSPYMVWRLRPLENALPPSLLRTATYNNFRGSIWRNLRVSATDFKDLDTIEPVTGEIYHLLAGDLPADAQKRSIHRDLPRFSLRGAASAESPLALPGDAASVRDFELDGIERNTFGTVRVFPKRSVIEGTVLWKGDTSPESPPVPREDLEVPALEKAALQGVLSELRLDEQATLPKKLAVIRSWFQRNFNYSRTLAIRGSTFVTTSSTPITQFLTEARSGHCEYFATATTLLLREAGIPARYTTGYAVMERDMKRGEFVIRGTHGHAWCRVWDDSSGRWIDLDTTPVSWLGSLSPQSSATQRFNDAVKRLREDFFLWRNRPANRFAVSLVMSAIGLGLAGFVIRKLWKSKRRLAAAKIATAYQGPLIRTPLHGLERQAQRHLGSRAPGQPFAAWLLGLRPALPDSNALDEAIELHQRLRFDPVPPVTSELDRLTELADQLESELKAPASRREFQRS